MNQIVLKEFPRLPLDGKLDLTYRCNNNCRHCWLWLPHNADQGQQELSFDEIRQIVDDSRQMGCQAWSISGGEPMLRPDFPEIFDYLTRKSVSYSLNTNGTLITHGIARQLVRRGKKMVALYGATADVHDRVTRNPGSYEATMRGFAYLKEAGAGFTVQIIPMKENYHQYGDMLKLAQSLSPHVRVGAAWLHLSACGSASRNREITRQRLDPAEVVLLDEPDPTVGLLDAQLIGETNGSSPCGKSEKDDCLFASCISARRDFHIDPYGQMTFCCFIKAPDMRFNLRQGTFHQAWEEFIPSLREKVHGGQEYLENCGSCELRQDCHWCGVYSYLEHGRFSAKVDYLCQVARETRQYNQEWKRDHLRYYKIAGITIQVTADFPITRDTFASKFDGFQVDGPGEDNVSIRLFSRLPELSDLRLGKEIYRKAPWAIYRQSHSWIYLGITPGDNNRDPISVSIFNPDHSRGSIFLNNNSGEFLGLQAITALPTDQILLARLLADRQGCYLHASGMIMDGKGLLFVGHSEAGKSTMLKMLRGQGEILCDDRVIVRHWPDGFQIHGTWSHGELPDVSPASAPLRAILYLEKASENVLIPIEDKKERLARVLSYVIKPLVNTDWWEKTLVLAGKIALEVPAYRLRFDQSGKVSEVLKTL